MRTKLELDVAIKHSIPHGGAIPKGRLTEDGVLSNKYQFEEMTTKSYPKRTEKNVVDSGGTVILTHGKLTGGSLLTRKKAVQCEKPVLHLDMGELSIDEGVDVLKDFVDENAIEVLNVARTRASGDALIHEKTFQVLETVTLND